MKTRAPLLLSALLLAACSTTAPDSDVPGGGPGGDGGMQITSIVPDQGPVNGGTIVEIFGTGLDDGTGTATVSFGSTVAEVISVSAERVRVVSPAADAQGPVGILLTHSVGATSGPSFTYGAETWGGAAVLEATVYLNPAQFQGAVDVVDAFAHFASPTTSPLLTGILQAGECVAPTALVSGNFVLLDTGDAVELTGPAGTLTLPRQEGPTYFPTDRVPSTAEFVPGSSYDLNSAGGATLPSLDELTVLQTPEDFDVLAPDITAYPYLPVSRTEDLLLDWTAPAEEGSAFYVQLEGWALTAATGEVVRCWADDTGQMTIPATVLAQFALADRVVVKMVRRTDTQWQVSPNKGMGQATSMIRKIGLLGLE